jgi:hypothetical protein
MTRTLALALLLAAGASLAQDAAPAVAATPDDLPAAADAPEEAVELGPVARWEADRTVILDAAEIDLAEFEYLARPLVVFADNPRQPQFIEQMRLIETDLASLGLRDVAIVVDSDPDARSQPRRDLRPRGFAMVLVDKDGRVILRRPAPTSVREITRAIDRSPIRQEEIRYREAGE